MSKDEPRGKGIFCFCVILESPNSRTSANMHIYYYGRFGAYRFCNFRVDYFHTYSDY